MKPINRFALILWIVAALFLLADIPMIIAIRKFAEWQSLNSTTTVGDYAVFARAWNETRDALLGAGQLAGIGVLIELIDKIRWNSLSPEAREQHLSKRSLWRRLRRWPHAEKD
jgi:hypothetical protein